MVLFINHSISHSINQLIHPSIHPSIKLTVYCTKEKHIAFLWLNNMLLLAVAILKSISISIQKKVGKDDQTNTRTCCIEITCIIKWGFQMQTTWLVYLRWSLIISWVFLHKKCCSIPPCQVQPEGEMLEGDL